MTRDKEIGLYWHIPFCRALCTYCDFAKTANYDDQLTSAYLARLGTKTIDMIELWRRQYGAPPVFTSFFLGGGTPSLFAAAYVPLFERLRSNLAADCEITLEANPDDLTPANLAVWRDLGVTRLSVGVQTFDAPGLKLLGRTHDGPGAMAAIERAAGYIPRVSLDLIYGWPGQTAGLWAQDLNAALSLPLGHLSLYTLTYEPRTPLGRRQVRGVVKASADDFVANLYDAAVDKLGAAGFDQDEVSNWSKGGQSSRHNYLYWQDASYIGVGAGAHGYFSDPAGTGWRYSFDRSERVWSRGEAAPLTDEGRDDDAWILEYVGSALRCDAGVDLTSVMRKTGRRLTPTRIVADALSDGQLRLVPGEGGERLLLAKGEWFRETAWSLAVAASLGVE